MLNGLKKLLLFSLIAIFTFTGFTTVTAASAANVSNGEVNEIRVDTKSMPKSIYVKDYVRNSYGGIPPGKISHTLTSNGVIYTGMLTRTDYQALGDGRYLALYSGYVYR